MAQQVDLFLDSMVSLPWREDRALMEFPFFSLEKTPRMEPIVYDDGRVTIRVAPGEKGIATIWDKDILIYITSLLNDRIERGLETSRTVVFGAREFLTATGRRDGGVVYEQFKDALFRLRSTTITTSIQSDGEEEDRGFGWIESWRVVRRVRPDGSKVMQAIEVTLNDWMYRAIVGERRVLAIDPAYFKLSKGLERRLYELVRKHLGHQPSWTISLSRLAEKIGTRRDLRRLRAELAGIAARDTLINYVMRIEAPARTPGRTTLDRVMVTFEPRRELVEGS
jgi:plasmid replication initiation protein